MVLENIFFPFSFFQAPYKPNFNPDYSSLETKIQSSYGNFEKFTRIFIRVDPDYTFVFPTYLRIGIRHHFLKSFYTESPKNNERDQFKMDQVIVNSEKLTKMEDQLTNDAKHTMTDYFDIILNNIKTEKELEEMGE